MDAARRSVLVGTILYLHLHLPEGQSSASLNSHSVSSEYRLASDLLDGYLPSVRPRKNSRDVVEVVVGFDTYTLTSMVEKAQTMSIVGWFYLSWTDEFMVWDPAEYDNVPTILMSSDKVWLPDLVFSNGVDKLFYDLSAFRVLADSNGSMLFQPGGPIDLTCNFNLMYYPFDEQMCEVVVVAWTTAEDKMKLTVDKLYIDKPVENGEWKVIKTGEYGEAIPYPGGNYSQLTFKLLLQRKPQYQVINVVIPIITLPLLNLAVFQLPPECGEKISLSITVLLAFSVWLLMMSSITPSSSDNMPVVAICTVIFMALSTISVIVSVIVVHLHHKDTSRDIPAWVQKVLHYWRRKGRRQRIQVQPIARSDGASADKDELSWKDVAVVVDGIAFYSFLAVIVTVIIVGALAILINAPKQSAAFSAMS